MTAAPTAAAPSAKNVAVLISMKLPSPMCVTYNAPGALTGTVETEADGSGCEVKDRAKAHHSHLQNFD